MNYADINKRYTATVAEYMAKGYTINTRTMTGSQGDYAHIDLTDGTEFIRILVDTFHEWTDISLDGLEIIVGRADGEVKPNSENDYHTLWNNKLPSKGSKGKSYAEYQAEKTGTSWKGKLKTA